MRFESEEDCLLAGNALAQVGADALRDRWMDQLSGGEKQRVILARALAQQPSLLLLDEPTQHLDIGGKVELLRRLRKLADEHRYTVVVVTHELNLAAEFSDRIVLMHKGKCLRVGTPAEVYEREVLQQVFEAPLEVEIAVSGRPRVILRRQPLEIFRVARGVRVEFRTQFVRGSLCRAAQKRCRREIRDIVHNHPKLRAWEDGEKPSPTRDCKAEVFGATPLFGKRIIRSWYRARMGRLR